MRAVAAVRKLKVIDIRASLLDPTDLRGIPSVDQGKAVWCPPDFLPHDPASKGILFFDELNAAPTLVQASLYQLTLDRRIGEYRLPKGWMIIAAGNRDNDGSVTFRMPTALANRFIHIEFDVDFDDWRTWAMHQNLHHLVTGFLTFRPSLLWVKPQSNEHAFATPRSWEMISDLLGSADSPDLIKDVVVGVIGMGPATEFLNYCSVHASSEWLEQVLENSSTCEIPEHLGHLYALITYLISMVKTPRARAAAEILMSRLKPEFAIMLLRGALLTSPEFATLPGVLAFCKSHKSLLI